MHINTELTSCNLEMLKVTCKSKAAARGKCDLKMEAQCGRTCIIKVCKRRYATN